MSQKKNISEATMIMEYFSKLNSVGGTNDYSNVDSNIEVNIDPLTGCYNIKFLKQMYNTLLSSSNDCYFLVVDFKNFKYINDKYLHAGGDSCLKSFVSLSRKNFPSSVIIRNGGDEFCILTSLSPKAIEKAVNQLHEDISELACLKIIPTIFEVNCGIIKASKDMADTMIKADMTMYAAKQNNQRYKWFDESIYKNYIDTESYLQKVDKYLNGEITKFEEQDIFGLKDYSKFATEYYSRDFANNSFYGQNYELLLNKYLLKKIDFGSIKALLKQSKIVDNKIVINVHNQTLISKDDEFDFIMTLESLLEELSVDAANIILSINVNSYNGDILLLIQKIEILKSIGFNICLDGISYNLCGICKNIWEYADVNYVKIDGDYWKKSLLNIKADKSLRNEIDYYEAFGTKIIFKCVETAEEFSYITDVSEKGYAKGYYLNQKRES